MSERNDRLKQPSRAHGRSWSHRPPAAKRLTPEVEQRVEQRVASFWDAYRRQLSHELPPESLEQPPLR